MHAGEDALIIERYLRGEREAVALVERWLALAAGPFRSRLGLEWDDALQEARMEAFRQLQAGRFRGEARLKTYLGRLAFLTCLDARRRQRRRPRFEPEESAASLASREASPYETALRREGNRSLLALLEATSPKCRELWGMILRGVSYGEMAERLGASEGALRVRVHRCRKDAEALLRNERAPADDEGEEKRRAGGLR